MAKKTTVLLLDANIFYAAAILDRMVAAIDRGDGARQEGGDRSKVTITFPNFLSALDSVFILLLSDLTQTELYAVERDLKARHGIVFQDGLTFSWEDPSGRETLERSHLVTIPIASLVDRVAKLLAYMDHLMDLAEQAGPDLPFVVPYEALAPVSLKQIANEVSLSFIPNSAMLESYRQFLESDEMMKIRAIPII